MNLHGCLSSGARERRAQSYLVRVWLEPREVEGKPARVRGFVRDLRTGEERYLNDPAELSSYLGRQLGTGEWTTTGSEEERNVSLSSDTTGRKRASAL